MAVVSQHLASVYPALVLTSKFHPFKTLFIQFSFRDIFLLWFFFSNPSNMVGVYKFLLFCCCSLITKTLYTCFLSQGIYIYETSSNSSKINKKSELWCCKRGFQSLYKETKRVWSNSWIQRQEEQLIKSCNFYHETFCALWDWDSYALLI